MPTIDSGWLDEHQRFPPPGPKPRQKQPKQPVSWAKAPIRTSEDAELVAQGKSLEQELSTRRRPSRSDRIARPDDSSHRCVECRPVPATSMDFWPDAILARHRRAKAETYRRPSFCSVLHAALRQGDLRTASRAMPWTSRRLLTSSPPATARPRLLASSRLLRRSEPHRCRSTGAPEGCHSSPDGAQPEPP